MKNTPPYNKIQETVQIKHECLNDKYARGFTIMELILVIVMISIIAGFAMPNYTRAILKAHERDAVMQLTVISAANAMYNSQIGTFVDDGGGVLNVGGINAALNINIIANGINYTYDRTTVSTYTVNAAEAGGAFTLQLDEGSVDANNPCCFAGACPSRPAC